MDSPKSKTMSQLLLFSVLVISTCGLIYELVAGALASYLLGDSVTQFSTIIGVYLFSMGIGSWISRHIHRDTDGILVLFIRVEILVGLIGGSSAALLFASFEHVSGFRVLMYSLVALTGTLVGLEIPLLMRILKKLPLEGAAADASSDTAFSNLVSRVFTFDYAGALVASLVFPLILVPRLGLVRSSFLFGIFNVGVAIAGIHLFRSKFPRLAVIWPQAIFALVILVTGFAGSDQIMNFSESSLYPGQVVYSKSTPYQRIVLSRTGEDMRLYLNSHLQFSSRDEYRYHEALVHPGLDSLTHPKRALILGGGDGMALREVLKSPSIESVTLVDLDKEVTHLFSGQESLRALNGDSLSNPKARIINADAFVWLRAEIARGAAPYDFIVLDFPDPANYSVGKLYTTTFFGLLHQAVKPEGIVVVQSTSPLAARKSYWCIERTLSAAGFETSPYHTYVPSFGEWGFVIGRWKGAPKYAPPTEFLAGLKFVNAQTIKTMFEFPPDMAPVPAEVNHLNNQALVRYYENEWSEFAL